MIHIHWIDIVWLDNIVVNLGCLAHNCIVLASVFKDQTLGCRVDYIALDSTKLFWQIIPELAILIVVEVLLWRRSSSLVSVIASVAFLHYWEEISHFILGKVCFAKYKNHLVLSRISSEASKEKDISCFGVIVEDSNQSEFTHVELFRLG